MAGPATRVWAVDEVLSASNMVNSINTPIEYAAGRALGRRYGG